MNMEEGLVVTSMAAKLVQEALKNYFPVCPEDSMGKVLEQVQHDLPEELSQRLCEIWNGRQLLQHNKSQQYEFVHFSELEQYVTTMISVLKELCPNWKLEHYNHGASEMQQRAETATRLAKTAERKVESAKRRAKAAERKVEKAEKTEVNPRGVITFLNGELQKVNHGPKRCRREHDSNDDTTVNDIMCHSGKRPRLDEV